MIYFKNTTLKVYRLKDDATGLYGETVKKYVYDHDIVVDFQNENNNEVIKMYGMEKQNMYKIYADMTTDINDTDRLQDDASNCYAIVGQIRTFKQFHKYKKANLIRLRQGSV